MADKRVIKFTSIASFFRDNTSQLQRGENSYSSGYVATATFDPSFKPSLLKGEVSSSMKKRKYNVEIMINDDEITDAKCSCPRREAICHHMAALCIYAHHNISVADQLCTWGAPSETNTEEIKTLSDFYPLTEPNYCAVKRHNTEEELNEFKKNLNPYLVGLTWLLENEPKDDFIALVPCIESIIFSSEYGIASNKPDFVEKACILKEEIIFKISKETIRQLKNENWLIARKHRLIASHFGDVLAACKRNRFPHSLFERLLETYDLDSISALQWERVHEPIAVTNFEAKTGYQVSPSGIWLDKCGFLGASPDGFVGEDALIEVKCPYKYRAISLKEALKREKGYVIYKDELNQTVINPQHNYYHQIQGQLYLTNKKVCYLVIWTPAELEIVKITKDEEWGDNLDILKTFYLHHYIPFLISMK